MAAGEIVPARDFPRRGGFKADRLGSGFLNPRAHDDETTLPRPRDYFFLDFK
jgi:hypothetical protein